MHQPYTRIVPDSTTAVLMVHGILGTPRQFDFLLESVPPEWSVYNILLDGHGKGVQDFSDTSMYRWERQVRQTVGQLTARYDHLLLVGHSMGTLLLLDAARVYPERVRGLFLLNVPLVPTLKPDMIENSLKNMLDRVDPEDTAAVAARNACSIDLVKTPWSYIGWLPRYLELFRKMHDTPPLLERIHIPCMAYHSAGDELVAARSLHILRRYPAIQTYILPHSRHFYYTPVDCAVVRNGFRALCSQCFPSKDQ